MTDTNKLKELAAQYLANPSGTAGEDSEFRAAANPQAILGLIAEIERLNALLKAEKYAYKDKQKHYEWLEEDLKECASAPSPAPTTWTLQTAAMSAFPSRFGAWRRMLRGIGGCVELHTSIHRSTKHSARPMGMRWITRSTQP
ncbi:hypothetical protein [Pseudomonas aeruginosa]|uniref:hypothetical protein n=1 Tax=Pseudomonas aeruginosa TaxID=287 RepID=UPI00345842E5